MNKYRVKKASTVFFRVNSTLLLILYLFTNMAVAQDADPEIQKALKEMARLYHAGNYQKTLE